jgi:glyoxylase-like metal-dependent hydrolase (beta-lactamase superfamily II)
MIFEQLNDGQCKTYLVASEATRDAALVDPVLDEVAHYIAELDRRELRLRLVIDTHVHADHISGGAALRDRLGVDYVMHHRSVSACANVRVGEGDVVEVGDVQMRVLHTPGHTQDSISLLLPNRLLTGDFLFIGAGGAGRTDLPGGDAGEHWDSLQKLEALPGSVEIFPAHDYHGRQSSTLERERAENPRLKRRTRAQYVAWLDTLRLGPAEWMAGVIQANYACALDPGAAWIPADQPTCEVGGTKGNVNAVLVHTVSIEGLTREIEDGATPVILDVRDPEEFGGELGHIPGARLLPVGELARRLGELAELRSRPIVTVCRSGGRSSTAAAVLSTAGFEHVRSLDGGMVRWNELGLRVETST